MSIPDGISTVTVTGKYIKPDGTALAGSVTFATDAAVRLPDQDATSLGSVTVALGTDGSFSVILIATDNADARPTSYTYTVVETLTGQPSRTYAIALPKATPNVDLADIAPAVASAGEYLLVTGPAGKTILNGTSAPDSSVGTNGDFYLDYTAWTIYGPKAAGSWPSGHALGSGGAVASVNGHTGTVVLAVADITGAASTTSVTTAVGDAIDDEVTRADDTYLAKEDNLAALTDAAAARANLGITPAAIGAETPAHAAATYSLLSTGDTGPWVFNVKTYGAVGDGKVVADGAMTSGSAALACTTSTPFASSDVGKRVLVKGAGNSTATTLVTSISGFTDSGHLTLAANATTTITSAVVMWATDDTAAIQSAINAAVTWASANSGAARVFFPGLTGFYGIAGSLVTGGSTLGNSQLTIPVVASTGRKITLQFDGVTSGAGVQHWLQHVPQVGGSTLVSFGVFANATAQSTVITANANPAVLGGPNQVGGYGTSALAFSNMAVVIRNLNILTTYSAAGLTYTSVDLSGVADADIQDFAYGTAGVVVNGDYGTPNGFSAGLSVGLLLPANGNNDMCVVRNITCHGGYTYGFFATEHTTMIDVRILYSWSGLCVTGTYMGSAGASHAVKVLQISIESCTNEIHLFGAGASGIGPFLDIDQLDTESGTPLFYDQDSGGAALAAARGTIVMTGLYTQANIATRSGLPTGLRIVDGQNPSGVRALSTTATVRITDRYLLCNTTSAGFTVTLISAVATPNVYTFKNVAASNTLTLHGAGSETIDGSATKTVAAGAFVTLVSDGTNWVTV